MNLPALLAARDATATALAAAEKAHSAFGLYSTGVALGAAQGHAREVSEAYETAFVGAEESEEASVVAARAHLPLLFGMSHNIPAMSVRIGDHVAVRNSCGGLTRWDRVTSRLAESHGTKFVGVGATGGNIVDTADELIEVRARVSAV